MKTTHPLQSGKLMTRILRLQEDVESQIIALEGICDDGLTFHELKHFVVNRFSEIKSSLRSISESYEDLVLEEYQEILSDQKKRRFRGAGR